MAKANGEQGPTDIDSSFGDDMLDAALDDAIQAAVAAGEEALAEVAASSAQRSSEQMEVPRITSGILDIRKLSETYEAERSAAHAGVTPRDRDDAVPMLGIGSARSLHVLAPQDKEPGADRWLYFAIGFASATVLTAALAVAIYFLALRHDASEGQQGLAAAPDTELIEPADEPAPEPEATPDPEPAADPEAEPTPDPAVIAALAHDDASGDRNDAKDDSHDRSDRDRDRDAADDRDRHKDRDKDKDKDSDKDADKDRHKADREVAKADTDKEPEPAAPAPATGGDCDEVQCLMDPSKPCCVKAGLGQTEATQPKPEPASALPERPTRSDVAKGMDKIKGRVQSCADRNDFTGTVRIKFTVSTAGDVDRASTTDGTGAFQSCVADVVSGARFPESQKGITVTYPLLIK